MHVYIYNMFNKLIIIINITNNLKSSSITKSVIDIYITKLNKLFDNCLFDKIKLSKIEALRFNKA